MVIPGSVNNEVSLSVPFDWYLKLLGVDIHLEQGVTENVSKATGVEVAVRPAIELVIIDLRELKATELQQLIIVKLLVGHVNLQDEGFAQISERL